MPDDRESREDLLRVIYTFAQSATRIGGVPVNRLSISLEFSNGDILSGYVSNDPGERKVDEPVFFCLVAQQRAKALGYHVAISKPRPENAVGGSKIQGARRPGRRPRRR